MDIKYTIVTIGQKDYFDNESLYKYIKHNYWDFRSCMYGDFYVNNIPSTSTYTVASDNDKCIYENMPAPNPNGCKMFCIKRKTWENLTIFLKTKGRLSKEKLKIKLENNLFDKILKSNKYNKHNLFILCKTKHGKFFVHANSIKPNTTRKLVVKKFDTNSHCNNIDLFNGYYDNTTN